MQKLKTKIFKACLFDLYDTLVLTDKGRYRQKSLRCAKMADIPPEDFESTWQLLTCDSNMGVYPTTQDRMKALGERLGIELGVTVTIEMARCEHDFLRSSCHLYKDSLITLSKLRSWGLRLGIISNASPSVREVLKATHLEHYVDNLTLSFQVGIRKPDPEIYLRALHSLGVKPEYALFVGDGNDQELEGAKQLGMTTVRVLRNQQVVRTSPMCDESAGRYTITNLTQVFRIIFRSS